MSNLININIMKNYKITNLKSKVVQFMNEREKEQFFTKNSLGNYKSEDVNDLIKTSYNKNIHDMAFSVFTLGVFTIILFLMCNTFSFIDSLIF